MSLFKLLLQKLRYLKRHQLREVYRAYRIARDAHLNQKRDSGEEYITHPLAVSSILASMHLDHESIIAALLHDVIEDTKLTKKFVKEKFSTSIADLVDGVTKLMQIEFSSKAEEQAESFRKMVLAMSHDIRVILVKLADRLHNMRTIKGLPAAKRQRIARETLDIYAPIANRLGMHEMSVELESLAFVEVYPRRYRILKKAVESVRGNRQEVMDGIKKELHRAIVQYNLASAKIVGREKHLYGIYKKMQQRRLSFTEIMDVYGFRIIVDTQDECYLALGVVHSVYKPIPGKFKDYIAIPKYNGYQSLHTKLCGPYGIPVEIQIRTTTMDHMADSGISAHWFYKMGGTKITDAAHIRAQQWVNNLLEIQKHTGNPLEFIENVKVDLFPDEVYVFTPKGHIMELPRGATVVDFAYAIHTDVGNSCAAARIDRHFSSLSATLVTGQTVSIITVPGAKPDPAWLNFVVTSKARSNIRALLKSQKRSDVIALGMELLGKALAELDITYQQVSQQVLAKILHETNIKSVEDLYESIGLGNRLAIFIAHQIGSAMQDKSTVTGEIDGVEVDKEIGGVGGRIGGTVRKLGRPGSKSRKPLIIKNAEGVAITFASCCSPIPGDAIVGYFNVGHGLEIHTEDCAKLAALRVQTEKYMPVRWADDVKGEFQVVVNVEMVNQRGTLAKLTQAISDAHSSIDDIKMSECSGGYCLVTLIITVENNFHLEHILQAINSLPMVMGVIRKK